MNAPQHTPPIEPLLDANDVAKLLKVARKTVYALHRSRELQSVSIGAAVRFRPEDVRAYVERLARAPATVTPISSRGTMPREG